MRVCVVSVWMPMHVCERSHARVSERASKHVYKYLYCKLKVCNSVHLSLLLTKTSVAKTIARF